MPITGSADNLSPDSRFMALFVGPKHAGKTVAACSWISEDPKLKVKVHDYDGRIKGILGAPWLDTKRIEYDYFQPRGTEKFYIEVNKNLEALLAICNARQNYFETFVCDSMTSFCKNLIIDALPLTHATGGKKIGIMDMAGPADYGFESTGVDSYMSFLRSLPMNVIVTAHVVDKFDKPMVTNERGQTYKDVYAESIVVGEKLSLRDKIGTNLMNYFDHIFRFDRKIERGEERFYVEYINDIACTSYPGLKPGRHDITGKNFRDYTMNLVRQKAA